MNTRHMKATGLVMLMSLGLSACAPVMLAGFAGTAMVASDRRTSGTQLELSLIHI